MLQNHNSIWRTLGSFALNLSPPSLTLPLALTLFPFIHCHFHTAQPGLKNMGAVEVRVTRDYVYSCGADGRVVRREMFY